MLFKVLAHMPDMSGSSRKGTLKASPADVVKLLGPPSYIYGGGGDGKVDREWVIDTDEGYVAIYAYKATSWYDEGNPSPKEFWESDVAFPLSIASRSHDAARLVIERLHEAGFDATEY